MILIISVVDTALMTLFGAARKVFLAVLARSCTTHHPHDLKLRLEPLLLFVEIMNGLDHWHMRMMTWVGPAPQRAF